MTGKKGMAWSKDKLRPTKKCSVALDIDDYEVIKDLARDSELSINALLRLIISKYILDET